MESPESELKASSECAYLKELEEILVLPDGERLKIRPVRPEDEAGLHRLVARLSPEEIRLRFLQSLRELPPALAERLTHIDYAQEMALAVWRLGPSDEEEELYGGVRICADPGGERGEFALLLRGDMTGLGLGPMLLRRIIDYARCRGLKEVYGEVLSENRSMLKLCRYFGFTQRRDPDDPGLVHVTLAL